MSQACVWGDADSSQM